MANRWLFIITRLTAEKGAKDNDEFVMEELWNQAEADATSKLFTGGDRRLTVFHGYEDAFTPEDLVAVIKNEIVSSQATVGLIGVLIHSDSAIWIGEVAKLLGSNVPGVKVGLGPEMLSKGLPGYSAYGNLARCAVGEDQSGFPNAFDTLWNHFAGDPILEAKLDVLHLCLTPVGARKLASETDNPYPALSADEWKEVKVTAEQLQKKKPFETDYVTALTELRTMLLEKEKTMASTGADN